MAAPTSVHYVEVASSDPELLTVRAYRLVRESEVVAHDSSIPPAILALARNDARQVDMGTSKDPVAVLAQAAAEGQQVVRLIGAGPEALADAINEREALRMRGIDFSLVPGAVVGAGRGANAGLPPWRFHEPAVIFLTGLSGAGKSTLATGLRERLRHAGVHAAIVDGDVLRAGLSKNLGFSAEDRHENLRRATELALHLAEVGVVAIVALISPFAADRQAAADRASAKGFRFAEVFVNAPLATCESRDPKRLYKRARAGEISNFTGIDSPYEAPRRPDLELHTDTESVPESVDKLATFTLQLVLDGERSGPSPAEG